MKINIITCLLILSSLNVYSKLDVSFSSSRGYYSNSFSLIIEADDPNAIIRYTTNGKTPTFSLGLTYGNPININNTKVVKAFAYSSTDTTKVVGHTYIFINDVLNQANNTPGFPYTTGFSNTIKNSGTYGPLLDDALTSIPVMCLSLNLADYDFIYNNKGISKQAYIEYFEPTTTESYGRPTGVSTYGNSTFSNVDANKKNYRLRFKDEFGASKFKYKMFGDEAASDFDVIDLRCGGQETFDRGGVQNIHEKIIKDWQIQISGYGVHSKFSHLYINGVYWGVYTASERPNASYGESYFGGDKEDYNTAKATCCDAQQLAIDGTINSYNYMVSQAGNYPAIEQYLDIDHFIDWIIVCNYGPHGDWTPWNTYAFDNPIANVPYRFFVWDPEPSFKNDWYYTDSIVNTRFFEDIWEPLKANADFRMRHADHTQCNCIEADGPLNPNNVAAYYDEIFQENKLAYLAEAARWADKDLYNEFLNYRDDILSTNWFFDRSNSMIEVYKNNNIYPNIDAVTFNQYGGQLNNGASISLSNPNGSGSIRYTIDRSDPRVPGGGLSSTAQTYNGSINLPNGVYEINARVKQNNNWSAMCPRKFYVGLNYNGLVINEIHYNPDDSIFFNPAINNIDTVSGRNFEFIELKNTNIQAIHLEDVHFNKGITLKFEANTLIPPGGFVVIAEDAYWFQQKYGFAPDATYIGKLENSGENIWLLDPFDNIIDTLRYDDALPWDTIPDNGKYSLALIDATSNNTNPANWSAQIVSTTPKAENIFCDGSLTHNPIQVNISCKNANDGFITGNAMGGTAPYTYQWDNGSNSNTISNLAPTTYILTLKDKFDCTYVNSYQITEPAALQISVIKTDESYYQTNDGTAIINVSGGTSPYTYTWSNGSTTSSINNLTAGSYSVNVTDNNGCPATEMVTIQAIDCSTFATSILKTDESYYQTNDGTAIINVSGGTSPYTYAWSTGSTTSSINNLTAGSYSVDVTDNNGCPATEMVTIQAIDCSTFATSISKTDESYYQTNDGTATINATGGASPYTYSWPDGSTTSSKNNLAPGSYVVDITDAMGCPLSNSFLINALTCSVLQVDVNAKHESCYGEADGLLQITNIQNGTTPYSILWSTGITGTVTNNLAGGSYQLNITDKFGCPFQESYTVNTATTLSINAVVTNASSNSVADGAVNLIVNGGTPPYNYLWSNSAVTEDINNLMSGNYWVTITDANNCQLVSNNFTVGNNCLTSIVQQNYPAVTTGVYQVAQFIQSNGKVNTNEQVDFKAGNYIELANDFEVIKGAEFEAKIEGCN